LFKKEAITMILIPASIILVAIIAVFFAPAYLISPCKNELIGEHPSPDGKYKAVLFVRDCGATTGFSTQVSLLRSNAQLKNGSGNLFIADTDHGKIPSGQKGGPEVRIVWEGSKDIYIVHHENARVFKAEKKVNGINVNYKSLKNETDNKANEADVKKPVGLS
jgi:hypothetical protein